MKYQMLLVDGPYLAHRAFGGQFQPQTSTGISSALMYNFMVSLNSLRKKFTPEKIIITWESYGTKSWRREAYPAYKPLKAVPHDYMDQLRDLKKLLCLLGVSQYYAPNNEADDVLATLSLKHYQSNIIIFTVDKDIMQIVNTRTHIYDGKSIYDSLAVKEKYGVSPNQIPDLLAIVGDSSDNIKGIQGYGPKKVVKILTKDFRSVEAISGDHPLTEHKDTILKNKELTTLNSECTLVKYKPDKGETIESLLDKYELKRIKEKIEEYKLLKEVE